MRRKIEIRSKRLEGLLRVNGLCLLALRVLQLEESGLDSDELERIYILGPTLWSINFPGLVSFQLSPL